MAVPPEHRELVHQFFQKLVEAVVPLQRGPDPEVTLERLIQAAQLLKEHLENELAELRQEQAE